MRQKISFCGIKFAVFMQIYANIINFAVGADFMLTFAKYI